MKKIFIIPNLLTTANLFCGFYSIILSTQGHFTKAAQMILIAAVFDALDGRIARLAKATSQFGVEFDSLSDLVSFGLAPSLLSFFWGMEDLGKLGIFCSFFYAACAAFRLARFNVAAPTAVKGIFYGVASPIAAGSIATFILFIEKSSSSLSLSLPRGFSCIFQCLALGSLMISTIKYPSFKEVNWRSRSSFGILLIGVVSLALIVTEPMVSLFVLNTVYLLAGPIYVLLNKSHYLSTH